MGNIQSSMRSYLGSPRNKPWDKDSSSSYLFGRWFQETQVRVGGQVYTMEYYSAIKKNEILPSAAT